VSHGRQAFGGASGGKIDYRGHDGRGMPAESLSSAQPPNLPRSGDAIVADWLRGRRLGQPPDRSIFLVWTNGCWLVQSRGLSGEVGVADEVRVDPSVLRTGARACGDLHAELGRLPLTTKGTRLRSSNVCTIS
jgi:hypothetical protein